MNLNPTDEQLENARQIVENSAKKAAIELGANTDPKIALGYTYNEFTIDTLGGVSGETFNDGKIDIQFNTTPEKWKANLQRTTAHEYAHTQFFQKNPRKRDGPLWKVILGEAQSTNLAERCFPKARPPTINAVNKEKLEKYWPQVRKRMKEKLGWNNEILFSDFYDSDLPMYYGYALAYQIGLELLKKHELKEFPNLEEEDVINIGDELFDN